MSLTSCEIEPATRGSQREVQVLASGQVEGVQHLHPQEEIGEREPDLVERDDPAQLTEEADEREQGADRQEDLDVPVVLAAPPVRHPVRERQGRKNQDSRRDRDRALDHESGRARHDGGEDLAAQRVRILGRKSSVLV
jgi:hypothetical protein